MSNPLSFTPLIDQIKGEVILPGNADYEAASTIVITKGAPAVIVRAVSARDVATAIAFAREAGLVISVRSGGHSQAGHSTNTGGMVIDMTRLNAVEVTDADKHTVRIGGGALWGDVAKALAPHGLAISSGDTSSVGVGGLALAGGVGWMVRKYGLALDNVLAVEIVTADGRVLRASADEHSDLFWAVRGGGGNFGVATSFEFTAHPVGQVYAGMVVYDLKDLPALLKTWRDAMRTAPEALSTMFLVMYPNAFFAEMPTAAMVQFCYADDDETAANQAIEPFLRMGTVLHKDIKRKDYADVLEEAHHFSSEIKVIGNNAFVRGLSDEVIDTISHAPGQLLQIRSVGGAMNRVAAGATAFAHRDSEVLIVAPTFVAADASAAAIEEALASWRKVEAFSGGAYISFCSEGTSEQMRSAYPPATYKRLSAIKKIYDPDNVFNQNYNIEPAA